jgi:hypothetical protein
VAITAQNMPGSPAAGERLADAAFDEHSQFGEDGIIARALDRLRAGGAVGDRPYCVEFGAWDGVHLSNTRRLFEREGARGVLIEADARRHAALERNCRGMDGVLALCRMVGWEGPDALDAILGEAGAPEVFDLLSIDIDGNDYHVWEALVRRRARLVVIEYNPTIPSHVRYVQPRDPGVRRGTSVRSMCDLAARKGYRLGALTEANAVFVDRALFPMLGLGDNRIETLRPEPAPITYLFQGMDGRCFLAGNRRMAWHDAPMLESAAQQLPGWMRRHPETFGPARRAAAALWRRLRARAARREEAWW